MCVLLKADEVISRRRLFQLLRVVVSVMLVALILRTISLREQVELLDGTVLEGSLEQETAAALHLRLPDGELRQVPRETIARDPRTGNLKVREGLLRVLGRVDLRLVVVLTLSFGVTYLLVATRWRLLLRAQGMEFSLGEVLRLIFIGMLFNQMMLGTLGGDVVKAYYVTRRARQKTAAVLTVFLDRVLGLLGLMTLCVLGTLTNLRDPEFRHLFVLLTAALLVVVVGGLVLMSRRLRRLLRVGSVVRRLPFGETLAELDRALLIYRHHKGAVAVGWLLSIGVHVSVVVVNWLLGWHLGLQAQPSHYFSLIPVALAVAALPISIAGWGVGEWAYAMLFSRLDPSNWTKAMALSVLFRLSTAVVWSLLGAVFLIRGERPSRAELEQEAAEEEALIEGMAGQSADDGETDGD